MSHQQDNLMKPNRQPAHSVRGSGTNSNHRFSSVNHSPTAFSFPHWCFPSFWPLRLKHQAIHSNRLSIPTGWLTSLQGSVPIHPHQHALLTTVHTHTSHIRRISYPSPYLILSCNILSLHTLNNPYLSLLWIKFVVGWIRVQFVF